MYDLDQAVTDFPWTKLPWSDINCGWFGLGMPNGWGDVIHEGLAKIDKYLKEHDLMDKFVIEQAKEKWGRLRIYFDIIDPDVPYERYDELLAIMDEIESESARVCCVCGTREGVKCRGGWVHYSCDKCEGV